MIHDGNTGSPADPSEDTGPDAPHPWYLYIIECADGTLYTGVATDVEVRVRQHNTGKGARYTRGRLPVALVYSERVGSRGDALRRELQIKKLGLRHKRLLIKDQAR